MTNRAKHKQGRAYQCKSKPIIQRDNSDGMLNSQPAIPATGNRVEHDCSSFALRLLHDQTRNLTLPGSTRQSLPNLPLHSQSYTISFMDIPIVYRPDLAVESLNLQAFVVHGGAQHIRCHHTVTQLHSSGVAFFLDNRTREAPEAFADTGLHISSLLVDKTATWQRLYTPDILKPGINQPSHFAHMASITWRETAQQPDAQFAHGFFWPTLFGHEK